MKVIIFQPQLDAPWRYQTKPIPQGRYILSKDDERLRQYWRVIAEGMCDAFRNQGHNAVIDVRPLWQVTPEVANATDADLVFIPHRTAELFKGLRKPALFYMQIMAPWFFVLDPGGWSSHSSRYPCDYSAGDPESGVFEKLAHLLIKGNQSKFEQASRKPRWRLALNRSIPLSGDYIFFPCQIPHDQAIELFSPYPEIDIVGPLAAWANHKRVNIVFKGHPINRKSMAPLEGVARGDYVRWSNASIHDLIQHCRAVYTINSGVGFESLLHQKPVVTFGRTEYDCVTVQATPDGLDAAWTEVQTWDHEARSAEYRKFIDWFCRDYVVDLSDQSALPDRLGDTVRSIERWIVKAAPAATAGDIP